jgi:anti-sigma28 factor (negative regulator of flagellin synthesis)
MDIIDTPSTVCYHSSRTKSQERQKTPPGRSRMPDQAETAPSAREESSANEAPNTNIQTKVEFLKSAIEEAQETNRFLDTKASILVAFESSLLVILISILIDTEKLQTIQTFLARIPQGYLVFLIVYTILYVVVLIAQILITLRVVLPKESPERHVNVGDRQPKKLFFLYKTDSNEQIALSTSEYSTRLGQMSEQDIIDEYVFELQKLSYIRKTKNDSLGLSFRILNGLIIGTVLMGLFFIVGILF